MVRGLLKAIVLIPVAAALVAWAVANRQSVTVSFDPFDAVNPAYVLTEPLYVIGFAILIAGVVVGGTAAWLGQAKWRKARARLAAEVAALRAELEALRRQAAKAAATERKPEMRALNHGGGPIANRQPAA
jgi:hypothetical protein